MKLRLCNDPQKEADKQAKTSQSHRSKATSTEKRTFLAIPLIVTSMLLAPEIIAGTPSSFGSVKEAIKNSNDFNTEDGSFKIIKENPLHIMLRPTASIHSEPDYIEEDVKRAVIYGIYRSFIHTQIQKITVSSEPMPMIIPGKKPSAKEIKYLAQFKKSVSINRDKALDLLRRFGVANEFSDLVSDDTFGDAIIHDFWSKSSERIRYNRSGAPGLNNFYNELIKP